MNVSKHSTLRVLVAAQHWWLHIANFRQTSVPQYLFFGFVCLRMLIYTPILRSLAIVGMSMPTMVVSLLVVAAYCGW